MIESELKLALMTRNLENHNRTTAYEWSEINGYLIGKKRLPQTLHSASDIVHIHRQEHSKALGTVIYKSHNIENTNFIDIFIYTFVGQYTYLLCGMSEYWYVLQISTFILLPKSKHLPYKLYYVMSIMSRLIWILSVCLFSFCCVWPLRENVLKAST